MYHMHIELFPVLVPGVAILWTFDMAFVTFVTSKFGFPFKNWQVNMYHMHV